MSIYDAIFELAACVELTLVLVQAASRRRWVPLGGGHIQQIGIVFGSAFIVSKLAKEVALAISIIPAANHGAAFTTSIAFALSPLTPDFLHGSAVHLLG